MLVRSPGDKLRTAETAHLKNRQTAERVLGEVMQALGSRSAQRLERLGATLRETSSLIDAVKQRGVDRVADNMASVLSLLDDAVDRRQRKHAGTSPELNCWSVLGLEQSEVQHSLVLAWLLDRRATHAQGGFFL